MEVQLILSEIVKRIREAAEPERIILFGSRSRGDAHAGSDFDIIVVKDSDAPRYKRSARLYTLLADLPIEFDVLVYTPAEIAEWQNVRQAFVTTAVREGTVLYERAA